MRGGLFVSMALLAAGFAGCFGGDAVTTTDDTLPVLTPGQGLNTDLLSQPEFNVLPQVVDYVTSALDGIRLHVEVYLPDGQGPWPTILENSPYAVMRANGETDALPGRAPDEAAGFADFRGRLVETYVPRGYAVVLAHVRGTGNSEGCMNMMGAKEQADTASLVEWVAAQRWSDGKVAMHGVSYVGTTPHEALIMAPEHLVTVVTVAGVTNQWRNVYQNGVPYSGRHYPLTYEAVDGAPPPTDVERGPDWLLNAASGACEQEEAIEAMSPGVYEKGVYTSYWDERNFTKHTGKVRAPILYSQGFVDRAVNPMEAIFWFNELPVAKKGFFHQAGHQYAPREDYFDVELAWFDHWLKGIENGVMDTPTVEVQLNTGDIRLDTQWPPPDARPLRLNLAPGRLSVDDVAPGEATYTADMAGNRIDGLPVTGEDHPTELEYVSDPLPDPLHMAGLPWAHLRASADAANTYFLLDLYDVDPDGTWTRLTEGWMNAHLWKDFGASNPLTPGQTYPFDFRFEPREYVFEAGHRIGLRIHGHDSRVFPVDELVTRNTVRYGGDAASWIELPVLDAPVVHSGEGINPEPTGGGGGLPVPAR